ncbi:MAG: D-alanine--D-alanine ligase [Clostridiales bacterium]|nr:D-alanine--D-alanine ligase [Clostridiales bacterium]
MKTALVIFGGVSSEHDVSTVSACSVIKNIPTDKYNVIMLGITKDGRWLKFSGDVDLLPDDKWVDDKSCVPAIISPDSSCHGLLVMENNNFKAIHIDVVFPVLHGKNGEDGTIQGLLQLAQIPFVGCDSVSSGVCMDKALTNAMADIAGIPQAKWLGITDYDYSKNEEEFLNKAESYLGFPIFVKPANAGSSVGVGKAKDKKSLVECIKNAFDCDYKIVLEECIDGTEVECAVLGNEEPIASTVGEIVPCNEFYDYQAKYVGDSGLHIPARIGEDKIEQVRAAAKKAYKALGCSGLARVDFFVRKSDGAVLLNEPNTIPGFTSISMYPKLFEASSIPYGELLDKLFTYAIEKWEK